MSNPNTNPTITTNPVAPQTAPAFVTDGFVDLGIIADLKIPYLANRFRKSSNAPFPNPVFDNPDIPTTNRLPLLGLLVDPFICHDLNGNHSPLIFPDPNWYFNNTDLVIRPYGVTHPLTRLAPSFIGWQGSLEFMVTVTSTMIVQGQISIVRGKYAGSGAFKWENIQLETDERDNCQLINLSAEKRVAKFVSYTETTDFINSMQYWLNRGYDVPRNLKPMNLLRNYLFLRADTDITTLSTSEGIISFKFYMRPGPDFQFMYPITPRRPDRQMHLSVVDKRFPFSVKDVLIVAVRPLSFNQGNTTRSLQIDDSAAEVTNVIPNTILSYIEHHFNDMPAFIDLHKYVDSTFPAWYPITGYRYKWASLFTTFEIEVLYENTWTTVKTYSMAELVQGTVLLEMYRNIGANQDVAPPYYYP